MKISKLYLLSTALVFMSVPAFAQTSLQREVSSLREDVSVLQRQLYRNQNEEGNSGKVDVVQMGQYDETIRKMVGKVDELEFQIRKINERIDVLNRDIDVRFKMLEGKPITSNAPAVAARTPIVEANAPVAMNAPKSITGDPIQKGEDLPPVKGMDVNEIYQKGLEALKSGDTKTAENNFNTILQKYPNDKLAGNAQYWQGEVFYGQKDYKKAAVAFANGYKNYKTSPKGADSLLKLGMSMRELKDNPGACAAFSSLKTEFPAAEKSVMERAAAEYSKLGCK